MEFSSGGGGFIDKYSVSNPNPAVGLVSHFGAGGYFVGGAAMAITRSRRFWVVPRLTFISRMLTKVRTTAG